MHTLKLNDTEFSILAQLWTWLGFYVNGMRCTDFRIKDTPESRKLIDEIEKKYYQNLNHELHIGKGVIRTNANALVHHFDEILIKEINNTNKNT